MEDAIKLWRSHRIPVFVRGEEEYERSVATSNLLFRFSRPECVVQPDNATHVQTVIRQAKKRNLKVTIKCGGHSYAGHSTANQGISLDLRKMNRTELDMESKDKTITFEAGCQWGHVYKTLINGSHNGYVINGGRCPLVGVGGFILGGGLGPFTRSIGMGCDALIEAAVVTAEGNLVTVTNNDDPNSKEGKLFWALCGAGGGNFGVVVEMKLRVDKLRSQEVVAGRYQWFPTPYLTDEFLTTMNDFYTTRWPDEMTIDSTWMCDLRKTDVGDGVRFLIYYDGNKDKFEKLINKYVKNAELAKQLKRRSLPEPSTRFLHETLVAQWSEETVRAFPTNKTHSIYSSFVFNNDNESIEQLTRIIRERMQVFRASFAGERVEFLVTWIHSGGKAQEPNASSAFFWRKAVYHAYVTVEWEDKWMERDMRSFLESVKQKLKFFSLNGEAAYVNFPDGVFSTDTQKALYERAYFGDNREDLRKIKKIWDPDNFFEWSQGVQLPPDGDQRPSDVQYSSKVVQLRSDGYQPPSHDVQFSSKEVQRPSRMGEDETLLQDATDGYILNEEDLTDMIARAQWDHFVPKDFVTFISDLSDMGL